MLYNVELTADEENLANKQRRPDPERIASARAALPQNCPRWKSRCFGFE
jgi:hypothetical protein